MEYRSLNVEKNGNVVQGIKSRNLISNRVKGNSRIQQERQRTYKETLRRVLATIVAVEKQ